jgi:hypothetical protein
VKRVKWNRGVWPWTGRENPLDRYCRSIKPPELLSRARTSAPKPAIKRTKATALPNWAGRSLSARSTSYKPAGDMGTSRAQEKVVLRSNQRFRCPTSGHTRCKTDQSEAPLMQGEVSKEAFKDSL